MLIEFSGLPGAGKSTLSHLVACSLAQRGCVVREVTYGLDHNCGGFRRNLVKLTSVTTYLCRHPLQARADIVCILATKQVTWADIRRSLFNWLYVASVMSKKRNGKLIVILDQGLAQALWSIGLAARDKLWLDLCSDAARREALKPDLIVDVKAGFQNVGSRLASRKKRISRIDSLGEDRAVLRRAQDHMDSIVQTFKGAAVMVLEAQNDSQDELMSNAQQIAEIIIAVKGGKAGELHA
jgi:thymidylate kinase